MGSGGGEATSEPTPPPRRAGVEVTALEDEVTGQPLQEVAVACLELLAEPGAGERTRLLGPRVVWREPLRLER